jgi:hypothetical protein
MTSKQRTWGQFATPTDVADLLLGFCLRGAGDRLLDPSCGDGALLRRAARWRGWLASDQAAPGALHGIELDEDAAETAATIPGATIYQANFFALSPNDFAPFSAIVGNPPYTRAEWISRLDAAAGQLPLFPVDPGEPVAQRGLLPRELGRALGGRAGLYAYFFLHSLGFLRDGGRLAFVVPNGWLDVAYGDDLKQFLLDHFRVVAVVESAVERWFPAARVNTCIVALERADDAAARAANRVRFVRLRRSLADLLGRDETDSRRVSAVESLITRLLPATDHDTAAAAVRVRSQAILTASDRWGALLRAPDVYLRGATRPPVPLASWAAIHRGHTTGANAFFYPSERQVRRWGIEPEYRRPLLKSLREVRRRRIDATDCRHELLVIPAGARLSETGAGAYVAWGESQGIDGRTTCAARQPWYALAEAPAVGLLLAKGVWQRHFVALADAPLAVDQQIYSITPAADISPGVAAALLNSAWFALGCELGGRVNLGEGVLWLAGYELGRITLPDPRALEAGERRALGDAFDRLASRPVGDTAGELTGDEQWALDELVFDLLGLSAAERGATRAALRDALAGRRLRAQVRPAGGELRR